MNDKLGDLMNQARLMQENLKKAQKEMSELEVMGEAGGGLVKVTMNGRHDTVKVAIDESLQKEPLSMLEDLIAAANNDAVKKLEKTTRERMNSIMTGVDLPGGMPFGGD